MGKMLDLVDKKFGRLTVQEYLGTKRSGNGHTSGYWKCICDCGNVVEVATTSLTSGNTKSCGCYKLERVKTKKSDYTGQQFYDLTVLSRAPDIHGEPGSRSAWHCRCKCGKEFIISQDSLISGHTKSCGCRNQTAAIQRRQDLTGQRFGYLVVKKLSHFHTTPSGQRVAYWMCVCDCGKEKVIRGTSLKSGYATSCGCRKKQILSETKTVDLTGSQFGYLTVLSKTENHKHRKTRHAYWLCQCRCGQKKIVSSDLLIGGHTTSCGCLGQSRGEAEIADILDKLSVKYQREYVFEDLLSSKQIPLRFDFAIFDTENHFVALIEYQGEQHFVVKSYDFGTLQREETDGLKREYCERNNIPLYYIKYNENTMNSLRVILKNINAYANIVPNFTKVKEV